MAQNIAYHSPIIPWQTVSGNTPFSNRLAEAAGQTFQSGVPIELLAGYVQVWDGATVTAGILGISNEFGHNLGSSGAGAPAQLFGQVTGTGAIQTYGSVPNQPGAVKIALGTPISDGRVETLYAQSDTIFQGQIDASSGAVYALTLANVGNSYGLTADGNGSWYIDLAKVTPGTNAVVKIVSLSSIDGTSVNGHANFKFLPAAIQLA